MTQSKEYREIQFQENKQKKENLESIRKTKRFTYFIIRWRWYFFIMGIILMLIQQKIGVILFILGVYGISHYYFFHPKLFDKYILKKKIRKNGPEGI